MTISAFAEQVPGLLVAVVYLAGFIRVHSAERHVVARDASA
jgi:hypothetical protein